MRFVVLALSVALSANGAAPAGTPASDSTVGGLHLLVAKDGPMKGFVDASPIARSEVALRADPRTLAVVIKPWGWILTVSSRTPPTAYLAQACATLLSNGIPPTTSVELFAGGRTPALKRTCARGP